MAVATENVAAAWAHKARLLADWTVAHLVNRTDQWAQYLPVEQRSYSRIVRICPPKQMRGQACLTTELLARHYIGANVGHLIGLHAKGVDNSARWVSIDLGQQDPSAPATPAANLKAALAWYDTLRERGAHPILEDSSGRGDYHLWVFFGDKVDVGTAWVFGRTLVSNYADLALPVPPRVFPRRTQVEAAAFKDWVRLPGRHHSNTHWSRIWDGARWLEGADAVDALLAIRVESGQFSPSATGPTTDRFRADLAATAGVSIEEQVTEVFQLPAAGPTPAAEPGEACPPQTPESDTAGGSSSAADPAARPVSATDVGWDDLNAIIRAWPGLPPVVKAGIMAMVHSAQTHG